MPLTRGCAALAAALTVAVLVVFPAGASARDVYLVDDSAQRVDVIDLSTGAQVAAPIPTGKDPRAIAINATGTRAYVANVEADTVTAIDIPTNSVIGAPIPVGKGPIELALAPDGRRLYVHNLFDEDLSVIDTATDTVSATLPIDAWGIAITADGSVLYAAEANHDRVTPYSTATGLPVAPSIPVGQSPGTLALSPDGRKLFVANDHDGSVTAIDVTSGSPIGAPIPVGESPSALAVTPDGRRLYVGRGLDDAIQVVDAVADVPIGGPISVGSNPYALAMAPDGLHVYTGTGTGLQAIDTTTGEVSTDKMPTVHTGLAIVPNQGPRARLTVALTGTTATLDAGGSSDPDGRIATYEWEFGDGTSATTSVPTVAHTYAAGASYAPRVTPVDAEGCGATRVGSGQITFCNPSAEPTASATVAVSAPAGRAASAPSGPAPGHGVPTPRGRAVLHLGRLVLNADKGTATLRVRVAEAGLLTVDGKGIARRKARAKRAGAVALPIVPSSSARRTLLAQGHLTVKVRVSFQSAGLLPAGATRSIGLIDRAAGPGGA